MANDPDRTAFNRRQFISRTLKAGVCAGVACAAGLGFHTNDEAIFTIFFDLFILWNLFF